MDLEFSPIRGIFFYRYMNTSCEVDLLYCKKYNKVYVRLCKTSKFKKDGEDQEKTNFVLFTIPAIEALLKVLPELINNAKDYKGVRYISIYFYFQRILYFGYLSHT